MPFADQEAQPRMSEKDLTSTIEMLAARIKSRTGSLVSSSTGETVDLANLLQKLMVTDLSSSSKSKPARDIVPEDYTQSFLEFINQNPTVFHATDYFSRRLEKAGFLRLSERESWVDILKSGGKYYVTRNGSNLVAFAIPNSYKAGDGVAIISGHIDAVTTKLKPVSKKPTVEGYIQVGVAPYSSGLSNTWWDRDLGIGGRVIVKTPEGKFESKLVKLDWPVARISSLAEHFGTPSKGPFNLETQMTPVIGQENADDNEIIIPDGSFAATQPPRLVKAVCSELGVTDYSSIISWELQLYEYTPGALGGLSKEFLFAPRLDDKLCSWGAIEALIEASKDMGGRRTINMCGLYDDEEIGSNLRQGAQSNLMSNSIQRILESFSKPGTPGANVIGQSYANSFLLSADVIHAVNNNFTDVYLPEHMPHLNTGLTVSCDPNGHMTTDSPSYALLQRIADKCGHTLQVFQIRNDSHSGGTIGPMLSAAMGVRSIDAGLPQLSMHSIRAATGAKDPGLGVQIFTGFYQYFEEVDAEFKSVE